MTFRHKYDTLCQRIERSSGNSVIAMKGNITVIFPAAQKHSWHVINFCWERRHRLATLKNAILFVASTKAALAGLRDKSESRILIMLLPRTAQYFVKIICFHYSKRRCTCRVNVNGHIVGFTNLTRDLPSRHTLAADNNLS